MEGRGRKWETVDQEVQANLNCCLGNTSGQATCHKGNVMSVEGHVSVQENVSASRLGTKPTARGPTGRAGCV